MRRPKYGIRRIDELEGAVIAWLYPGGADLDEVMTALAGYQHGEDIVDWWDETYRNGVGPDPEPPDLDEKDNAAWASWVGHLVPSVHILGDEHPTRTHGDLTVGWFRRFPWCHCGEGHSWHIEEASGPAAGASLALMLSWWC